MQKIISTLIILFSLALGLQAQPTTFGSDMVDSTNYVSYNLADRGAFRQVRLQAIKRSFAFSPRRWNFAEGTAGAQNFFNNWRPYSGLCNGNPRVALSGFNQVIAPATGFPAPTASATFNSNFGGCDGFLPIITAGNYYTINVTENTGDNFMAVLETGYTPATVASVSGPACATNCSYEVTVTLSNAPAAGEYAYVRYSTDGFATSALVEVNFSGATGTATIPGQGSSMVTYYVYTSNNTLAQINSAVAANGQLAHDMLTLELGNNSGGNFSYTACTTSNLMAVCQNTTVQLDDTGNASITTANINDGSFNNCGTVNLQSVSPNSFTCADAGANTVTLTINDGNGNTSTCTATVTVNSGTQELCGDGIDNDCNGLIDDDDPGATGQSTWYADDDGDTYGNPDDFILACNQPAGYVTDNTDCDDNNADANPGATEACNGIDDDCDNLVDADDPSLEDNSPPTPACQPATVQLSVSGVGSITPTDVFDAANSWDDCGTAAPVSVSPASFSCTDVGDIAVTLTVNDGNGNASTCSATVTVEDPSGFCSQVFCFDGETANLIAYVEGLGLNPRIARAITRRLELAAYKFCNGSSSATVISALNNIISYVQYQSGRSISPADADYIIAQAQALIDAVNAGTAQCCSGASRPLPANGSSGSAAIYELEAAPNPFRAETAISFFLPEAGAARLEVFSLQGQKLRVLLAGKLEAGYHFRNWDGAAGNGKTLSTGVYLARLTTENGVLVKRVSLVR